VEGKVSASVRRAYIPDTYAASGPEPGRILIPGDGAAGDQGLRIGLPAWPWRLRDARGLSRLNDFLALWSQAYMPSCNRQVTSTSIHMAKPGPVALLAVTYRCERTHCLWLDQFQIAEYAWLHVGSLAVRGARITAASAR
jgi:hypothetical protein